MAIWPTLPKELQRPLGFAGQQQVVRLIETHLSYVFLTEHFVYKLKKRLQFDFVDFSSLELREFYCREELRLNAVFAPELYLAVVPVVALADGTLLVEPDDEHQEGAVLEWAVKMRRFEQSAEADRLVEAGELAPSLFYRFGQDLAVQHGALPAAAAAPDIGSAIRENYATIDQSGIADSMSVERLKMLAELARLDAQEVQACATHLSERESAGAIKECHGDLHLSNMILADGRLRAFDCLEFNRELRTIDVWNDVAFLFMDCSVRERCDLAYAFIDGYLEVSADFFGLVLLPLYARYRSMVRAKVAALAFAQHSQDSQDPQHQNGDRQRFLQHLDWVQTQRMRGPGRLLVTSGLSGSGKSFWARQLVAELDAIRLRSDIVRKAMAGLPANARTDSDVESALYSAASSELVYDELARIAGVLIAAGESVIVDATCLKREQRDAFASLAAELGARHVTLRMSAPEAVLFERISARSREGLDPSEATDAVLEWQLQHQEEPQPDEALIRVDTCNTNLKSLVAQIDSHFSARGNR